MIHMRSKFNIFVFLFIFLVFVNISALAGELRMTHENCRDIPEQIIEGVKSSDIIIKGEILKVWPPPRIEAHFLEQSVKYRILNVYRGELKLDLEIMVGYYLFDDMMYLEPGEKELMLSKALFKSGNIVYAMLRGGYFSDFKLTDLHQASGMSVLVATEPNKKIINAILKFCPE